MMKVFGMSSYIFKKQICFVQCLVMCVSGSSYRATDINTIRHGIFKYGKHMDSYVMQNVYNYGPRMCLHACAKLSGCTGINYQNKYLYCELLRSSLDDQLISKQGFRSSRLSTWTIDNDVCWPNQCSTHKKCIISQNSTAVCIDIPLNPQRLKNVALFKPANQSSDWGANYVASYAVDGRLDTICHTSDTGQTWWLVNLLNLYDIHRIEIFNRFDYGSRLHDLDVTIGRDTMELCAHYKGPAEDDEHIILPCSKMMTGQFVKLALLIQGTQSYMHVKEVEVYGYAL